ncbi:hypothetical protein F5Y17DRAFT_411229 [Xylariaceae sp. FL0594]|nr:hypothetical protein F5Y17DRAFT_411229 [Xylariaceae sp. FL0594]
MAKTKTKLSASSKVVDPTLDALFASSAGPVAPPPKTRYVPLVEKKLQHETKQGKTSDPTPDDADSDEQDDEELSELDEDASLSDLAEGDEDEEEDQSEEAASEPDSPAESPKVERKDRKRKRRDEHDDLEGKYMRKLLEEEETEARKEKRRKGEAGHAVETSAAPASVAGAAEENTDGEDEKDATLVHESLQKPEEHADVELEKANRTLFLGNVSIEAITSSKAKKQLISHLESPLSELDASSGPHEVESLRFRSTPFSTAAKPKRAAYITKSVMEATARSTNAYAVFTTPLASRTALKALNGTIVLDRHLRVDSVAHPAPVAHRRCVFVGNLGFVDDETVVNTNAEGETTTKKRYKKPSDTEEGLWRVFGEHAGKVENVRVPRDDKTRVGKGFAYVQFYDENDVEAALLLNEKKFPPMLPRALRVSRAKDPRKTNLALERKAKERAGADADADKKGKSKSTKYAPKITPEQLSQAGRAARLLGRSAAGKQRRELTKGGSSHSRKPRERGGDTKPQQGDAATDGGIKPPEQFIFEGRRASVRDGKPKDLKFNKKGSKKGGAAVKKAKAKGRGARRAAEWRKSKAA